MSLSNSPELFKNIKNAPQWNDLYSWDDQDNDVRQFFTEEAKKVKYGITINGVFIPPWLYWHINFFPMFQDMEDGSRIPMASNLRDNEWFFSEMLQRAKEERKALGMFGCRRFGKALKDDEIVYTRSGIKKMGHVNIGDMIYDDSGSLVEVIGVYPQGMKETYRITFVDGRSVVCCGEHLWKVKMGLSWKVRNINSMIYSDFSKMSIPIPSKVLFSGGKWIVSPSMLGSYMANNILGNIYHDLRISDRYMEDMIMSSVSDREVFCSSFLGVICSTFSGREIFDVVTDNNARVLSFVKKIFWSLGYYCFVDGNKMTISNIDDSLPIKSIEYEGKYKCTCIEVGNSSHLFLTTNFIVTHNTAIMSSLLCHNATMTFGLSHSVVGFSDGDLSSIGEYSEYCLGNVHPFFRVNKLKSDWTSGVELGKRMSNNEKIVHAYINISNINMGKKSSTQKPASKTPYTAIWDEIGKGPIKKPYQAALPSYKTDYGMRFPPILAGTGGETEMSKDAQEMFASPESFELLVMDWSLLGVRCKEKTWKERKWGMFAPGPMALFEYGKKEDMGLGDYLGKPNDKKLNKINIKVTNFDKSISSIKKKREELMKTDRVAYSSFVMYYPLDVEDCFMNSTVNKFPVELAIKHKNDLIGEGRISGMLVDVFLKEGNKIGYNLSDKPLAEFPFKGGIIDCPVQIFEEPVTNDFDEFMYVCSLDPYKQAKADTPSLGSFYVYKRRVGIRDPYANRIVASYASRPSSIDLFCRTCEILQKGYGAICLMEGADLMYEQYLNRKSDLSADFLLFPGEAIANKYVKAGSRQNNKNGLYPTPANQNLLFSSVIDYCWQDIVIGYDEEMGLDIKVKGVELIDDIALLDEIIQYTDGKNVDRIISFGHALALARYYDDNNVMPKSRDMEKLNEERSYDAKRNPEAYAKAFSNIRHNPFR